MGEAWKNKTKEGFTRVVNGTRENMTDLEFIDKFGQEEFDKIVLADKKTKEGPKDPSTGMTRKQIQDKAKSLGINAKQTSKDLLSQIEVAERK